MKKDSCVISVAMPHFPKSQVNIYYEDLLINRYLIPVNIKY